MKKILGLDLGVTSIGSALIEINDENIPVRILHMGSRIIPLTTDDEKEFSQGNAITKNQKRTDKRQQRRGNFRYKQRRKLLAKELSRLAMLPEESLIKLSPLKLFELRAKAVTEKVSLKELGRIFYHLNQKRGYKGSRKEENDDAKVTEYEQKINNRFDLIKSQDKTIGQFFYEELKKDERFRTKEKVFPRHAYIEEFNSIWNRQSKEYPETLTDCNCKRLRDEIIFYQRPLKSQKGLVSICEFAGSWYKNKEGKQIFSGPKVAPRSSPLFQICKIWESINSIRITRLNSNTKARESFDIEPFKQQLFEYLDNNDKLSQTELFSLLGIRKNDGYYSDALVAKKGLQGNLTKHQIKNAFGPSEDALELLQFNLKDEEYNDTDLTTGEVLSRHRITKDFESESLYRLWHVIYSIPEKDDLIRTLKTEFKVSQEQAIALAKIDFSRGGYSNKSAKSIRNILPYLQRGFVYSDACTMAGYNHSDSMTNEENISRELKKQIGLLPKNSLRQPIVEKILNQMIHIVNDIIEKFGNPDEIRIELVRELKQSKEERNDTFSSLNKVEKRHKEIIKLLQENEEYQKKKVSRNDIIRYKLWEEFGGASPYEPEKIISLSALYNGEYDIEHIIPKSLLFDDSFSNKTICPRHMNSGTNAKNKMTAIDFMKSRSEVEFQSFLSCINTAFRDKNRKISKTKYERLLMTQEDIPKDFVARQLRETSYIAREARAILGEVCYNVYATSGKITEHLRRLWGWNEALMNLQLPKFREHGKTETITLESNGIVTKKEIIPEWSKRDDHRHHAIDALVVACTQQGFIQRMNTLNAQQTRDEMYSAVKNRTYREKLSLLDKYLISKKPFETGLIEDVVSQIIISFKAGKRVAIKGVRKEKRNGRTVIKQRGVIVPRGPLSEESVYGRVKTLQKSVPLKKLFAEPSKIVKSKIKNLIIARLEEHNNDAKKAIASVNKNPLWYNEQQKILLEYASVYSEQFVIKYPIQSLKEKDVDYIVDGHIKSIIKNRLASHGNNPKEAFKDLQNNPVWFNEEKNIRIHSVRCFTGLDVVEGIAVNDESENITYEKFVKPGNNHHIAIYKDEDGKTQEHVVTFWHAVERKKFGLPVVIIKPHEVWNKILGVKKELPTFFLKKLPSDKWEFQFSMQQNEMFVFNMSKEELNDSILNKDYSRIAPNLFRLRKITSGNYWFNQQYETQPRESVEDKKMNRGIQASMSSMKGVKVFVDRLGNIQPGILQPDDN